jgi:hypothetical protein
MTPHILYFQRKIAQHIVEGQGVFEESVLFTVNGSQFDGNPA